MALRSEVSRWALVALVSACGATSGAPGGPNPLRVVEGATGVRCFAEDGLECTLPQHVCTALPAAGAACSSECTDDAWCSSSAARLCLPKEPDGSPCETGYECLSGVCTNALCVEDTLATSSLCQGST